MVHEVGMMPHNCNYINYNSEITTSALLLSWTSKLWVVQVSINTKTCQLRDVPVRHSCSRCVSRSLRSPWSWSGRVWKSCFWSPSVLSWICSFSSRCGASVIMFSLVWMEMVIKSTGYDPNSQLIIIIIILSCYRETRKCKLLCLKMFYSGKHKD